MISTLVMGKNLRDGKYILDQELGEGGFACTYKATNTILNQPVVIKTLKPDLGQYTNLSDVREEFLNESQRLIRCYHPNIVRFYEFFSENQVPYIVMDYIPGKTLDQVVSPENPLSETTAIAYILQVAKALKVVHNSNLLHRDIKPQNLILRQDNQQVILIDFGIARELSWGLIETQTNVVSDGYAPIEQYLPRARRTPATDIYGLAATLYTLVTGEIPVTATLRHRIPLENPQKIRPELSNEISQAIMIGMGLEIEERPYSVDEWLDLLPEIKNYKIKNINTTVLFRKTKKKLLNFATISQCKVFNPSKKFWARFTIFLGLVLGLDYLWLRFRPVAENTEIPINHTKESQPITSVGDNVSDPTRIPDIFLSPHELESKTKSIVVPIEESKPVTPVTDNASDSTRIPDIFLSPHELDRNIEQQETTSSLVISIDNEGKTPQRNTMVTVMTIKLTYLSLLGVLGVFKKKYY
ncbi:MAG: serine/threonine-protein kinase [Xenococcaceae cyanobacterium MO_188.B19]|nr:serine/threonine-protein kinase [Xenococcaceae cyanobacterium MO_188.B19]